MQLIRSYLVRCGILPNCRHTADQIPVLGQGGAMAIEDAVCIARLLPKTTSASEVEGRLKCYEEIRYKRVEYVRDQTRKNGLDEDERSSGGMFCLEKFMSRSDFC